MRDFLSVSLICIFIFIYASFVIGGIIWGFMVVGQQGVFGSIAVSFLAPVSFIMVTFLHSLAIHHWWGMLGPIILGSKR
ncbi:MAG: hypothetical protein GY941_23285 [Planctomycetes bacterium]|nr:hypothetical protein [Planctomycetota bacterium]